MAAVENILTTGDYVSEADAAADFDAMVDDCACPELGRFFRVIREVEGTLIQPHAFSNESHSMRIDRIISPLPAAVASGWRWGCVGVEIKTTGVKIGRVVCQSLDYRRSVFRVGAGFQTVLDQVFIFPLHKSSGDIASVMTQNRIGNVFADKGNGLNFMFGGTCVLRLAENRICMNPEMLDSAGRKVGSR